MAATHLAHRFLAIAFVALMATAGLTVPQAEDASASSHIEFSNIRAVPLGNGNRIAFMWDTNIPTTTMVYASTNPDSLSSSGKLVPLKPAPDTPTDDMTTEHFIVRSFAAGLTVYFRVAGQAAYLGETELSDVMTVESVGAYNAYDEDIDGYVINLFVKFDHDLTSDLFFEVWEDAMGIMAMLTYDMTDGYVRIGTVILEDSSDPTVAGYFGCGGLASCLSNADIVIPTTAPFDSHTFGGGIASGDPIVLGRFGQLVDTWQSRTHRGFVAAHEMGHYAFWLDDQYAESGNTACVNAAFDVSIMHNSNRYTEMDHSGTPCAWQTANGGRNSWDDDFRAHYPMVPARALPDPGQCNNGSCTGSPPTPFEIVRIDR